MTTISDAGASIFMSLSRSVSYSCDRGGSGRTLSATASFRADRLSRTLSVRMTEWGLNSLE